MALNLFFAAYYLVVIVLAQRQGTPAGEIGVMAAMLGAGGILGALLAPSLHCRLSPHTAIAGVFWALAVLSPLAVFNRQRLPAGCPVRRHGPTRPDREHHDRHPPTAAHPRRAARPPERNPQRGRRRGGGPALGGLLAETTTPTTAVLITAAGLTAAALAATVNRTLRHYPERRETP